jgi:hypothetical protein
MNAITEPWIGDAAASCRTEPSSGTRLICGGSRASTRSTTTSTGRTAPCTAPLTPLPEPVDLGQYRVRRQTRISALISEYRLVA